MKKLFLLTGLIIFLASCQHSDICTENQPSTPKLVIKFYNKDNPNKLKKVTDFNAREITHENYYFQNPKNDTIIKIPLRTDQEMTTYRFVINQDSINQKSDLLEFNYINQEIYINRACGFKNDFHELSIDLTPEDQWIQNIQIPHNEIIDEKDTHIHIYH